MKVQDEIAAANEQLWARLVKEGCGYTIPWLNLDPIVLRQYAAGRLETAPDSLIDIYPLSILADVRARTFSVSPPAEANSPPYSDSSAHA